MASSVFVLLDLKAPFARKRKQNALQYCVRTVVSVVRLLMDLHAAALLVILVYSVNKPSM